MSELRENNLRHDEPIYLSSNGQCYAGYSTLERIDFTQLSQSEQARIQPMRRVQHRVRYNKYNADGSKKKRFGF